MIGGSIGIIASKPQDAGGLIWGPMLRGLNNNLSDSLNIHEIRHVIGQCWVAALSSSRVVITYDDGANWSPLPDALNTGATQQATAMASDNNGRCIVAFLGGFVSIVDVDNSYNTTITPLTSFSSTISSACTDKKGKWWLINRNSNLIYFSDDNLNSFVTVNSNTSGQNNVCVRVFNNNVFAGALSGYNSLAINDITFNAGPRGLDAPLNGAINTFSYNKKTGLYVATTNNFHVSTSPDLLNWTYQGAVTGVGEYADQAFNRIITVGGSGYAAYTDDGINFTALPRYLNSGGGSTARCVATNGKGKWMVTFDSGYASVSPPL